MLGLNDKQECEQECVCDRCVGHIPPAATEINEYVDDFWSTFNAEEKAALKLEGFEQRSYGIVIAVDFKTRQRVYRKDMR